MGCSGVNKEMSKKPLWIIAARSGNKMTIIDKEEITIIPNGRYISSAGKKKLIVALCEVKSKRLFNVF